MMLRAGDLNQRITITPRTVGEDAFGSAIESTNGVTTWENRPAEVWASVRQQGSNEKARNNITTTENTYIIKIRFRENVPTSSQITYRGRTLNITSVVEGGQNNREWLEISAVDAK